MLEHFELFLGRYDPKGDEEVEHLEDHAGVDEPVVVELAQELGHADATLVELGIDDLQLKANIFQDPVHYSRPNPIL